MSKASIAIVVSEFNWPVVEGLLSGAIDYLKMQGIDLQPDQIFKVPGAYELPWACQQLAQTKRFQGIVALGAVIRGETAHFDYVAGPCASGVMEVSLKFDLPIAFGVLTTETADQAFARSMPGPDNKGKDAAACLLRLLTFHEETYA